MNEFESESGMEGNTAIEELREQLRMLRMLLAIALVMLIGLSICADLFLSRQIQTFNSESAQLQMIASSFPQAAANDFVKRLREYAKTHPDFAPIAAKYPALFEAAPAAPKK